MKKILIMTLVVMLVMPAQIAVADTTGAIFPTLGTSSSEAPWSDNGWLGTEVNIYGDEGTTASVTAGTYDATDQTWVLKASGFDFSSIPDNSTINGVTVRVNAWADSTSVFIDLAQLLDISLAKVGTNLALAPDNDIALSTTQTTIYTIGGAANSWGNSLTAAWVKDPDFGVALGARADVANSQVFVDYVTIEIDYTPPSSAPTVTTNTETDVAVSSATINGEITATGGANATVRGFAWGTDSTLSNGDTSTTTESGDFGAATFSQGISNLLAGKTYYFRAYATNPTGTGYGSIDNLVTGTNSIPGRTLRLFEGFLIKLFSGKIRIFQR